MKMCVGKMLGLGLCLLAAGCSTDARYAQVSHEQLTRAATLVMAEEAHVQACSVQRRDIPAPNGTLTVLSAPYVEFSKIEAEIDSRENNKGAGACPKLRVVVSTGDLVFTRHKEWESRVHEIVRARLCPRPYGLNQPTAVPIHPVEPPVVAPVQGSTPAPGAPASFQPAVPHP